MSTVEEARALREARAGLDEWDEVRGSEAALWHERADWLLARGSDEPHGDRQSSH